MLTWQSPHGRALPEIGRRTLIMGVLNTTPDSFSDGGKLPTLDAVVARAAAMVAEGADVLDVGGESTRPGAQAVSVEEELQRVVPAIRALRQALPAVALSIDTYKAAVAEAAIEAGADIINDVWGLLHGMSPSERAAWRAVALGKKAPSSSLAVSPMALVAVKCRCPVVIMHNRLDRDYEDFLSDVLIDLRTSLAVAAAAGVPESQLWIDPGFGFAKDVPQNLAVVRELARVVALGRPVLVGTSRKSTLGAVLGTTVDDRLEGSGATVVWAIQQGC
ncbi:MAG TPA: dihydropteroate synthase, partial [Opitutus sp.]|nr:dihydropteroate synthase [Opitutus sp.]